MISARLKPFKFTIQPVMYGSSIYACNKVVFTNVYMWDIVQGQFVLPESLKIELRPCAFMHGSTVFEIAHS